MTKEYTPSWVAMNESLSEGLDPSWIKAINRAILRMVAAGKTDQEVMEALWLDSLDLEWGAIRRGDAYIAAHLKYLRLEGTELGGAGEAAHAPPAEVRGFTAPQIRAAVQELREKLDRAPTRAQVAARLHTSEATLKRATKDLRMGPWPPAPTED